MQVANYMIEAPGEAEEEPVDFNPVVVAEGSQPLKTLSVASAVAELLEWRLGALDERRAAAIAEDVQAIGEKGRAPSRRKK